MNWITSDTHFGHKNIVLGTTTWTNPKGVCRPFKTIEEHDESILYEINRRVQQDDILYHLGDFSFGGFENIEKYRKRIVCKNIHLFIGNHDHHIEKNREGIQKLFTSVQYYGEFRISKEHVLVMMHYPIASWKGLQRGNPHVYGHQHSGVVGKGRSMDVGIDSHGQMQEVYELDNVVDSLMKRDVVNNHHDSKIEVK